MSFFTKEYRCRQCFLFAGVQGSAPCRLCYCRVSSRLCQKASSALPIHKPAFRHANSAFAELAKPLVRAFCADKQKPQKHHITARRKDAVLTTPLVVCTASFIIEGGMDDSTILLNRRYNFALPKNRNGDFFETEIICTGACDLTRRSGHTNKPLLRKKRHHNTSGGPHHEPRKQT